MNKIFSASILCTYLLAGQALADCRLRVEAEDYSNYYDTTAGNSGGAYRSDDVDIEASSAGGYNVGWTADGEWLEYAVTLEGGTYTVTSSVASDVGNGAFTIDLNGSEIVGTQNVDNTGGWQNWQTLTSWPNSLPAGNHTLRVNVRSGLFNLDWLELYSSDCSSGTSGGETVALEAEDYSSAHDLTWGNSGGQYRSGDVDIEVTTDEGGGYNVGWIDGGEWLQYSIVLEPGTYTVDTRVASAVGGGAFTIALNGSQIVGTQNVPNTGSWQTWTTLTAAPVDLPGGSHTVKVNVQSGGFNINWLKFNGDGGGTHPDPDTQLTWSDEFDNIDSNNWTFETGGEGWGNSELQYYTAGDNAYIQFDPAVDSNVLVLEAREGNPQGYQCWYGSCQYTSTRMISLGKREFTYGRMEARIKLPQTQGIWPAFWMMGNDFASVGWPNNGEIDIMEHVGYEPTLTHGALHGPGYSGNTPINGTHDLRESADANYHVYAVEWDANGIKWYVDDTNFYSVSRTEVEQYGNWVYDHPFFFLFNVAVGGEWPGSPDSSSSFPQRMYIDYVRVYQ